MSVLEKGSKSGVGFCPQVPVIEVWFPLIIYFKEGLHFIKGLLMIILSKYRFERFEVSEFNILEKGNKIIQLNLQLSRSKAISRLIFCKEV